MSLQVNLARKDRSKKTDKEVAADAQLDFSAVDILLGEEAGPSRMRRSLDVRLVIRLAGAGIVSCVLGWTVYYDLLARRPAAVPIPFAAEASTGLSAIPFPANGTVFAEFQEAVVTASLTIQTPAEDPYRLFVLVFEDWQTGRRVAHVFLRANTVETLHVPPGRYRLVMASGLIWSGETRLFGPRHASRRDARSG